MRFFVAFFLIFVLSASRSLAQMASSVTSVPAASVLVVPTETTVTTVAPKGEYIEWRRGYVSGVSDHIITVVVSTAQRRGSYEPVEITAKTKITRAGRPATLKEIRIRQLAGVRGYRQGDIVKATEYVIGGLAYTRPARKRVIKKRVIVKPKKVQPKTKTKAIKIKAKGEK